MAIIKTKEQRIKELAKECSVSELKEMISRKEDAIVGVRKEDFKNYDGIVNEYAYECAIQRQKTHRETLDLLQSALGYKEKVVAMQEKWNGCSHEQAESLLQAM